MKKQKLVIFLFASATLLTGCGSTYSVTSKSMFNKTVNEVKADLAKQGYNLSGSNTETKNNVYVEGTSYSRYAGYGSKMTNDLLRQIHIIFSLEWLFRIL